MRARGGCVKVKARGEPAEKWPARARRGSVERVKTLLTFLILCGLVAGALFAPIGGRTLWRRAQERGVPRAVARSAAHGLRLAWDWVAALQPPAHPLPHPSRKAQAAAAHRVSREGIVAQPPKEKLSTSDKAALDRLVRH